MSNNRRISGVIATVLARARAPRSFDFFSFVSSLVDARRVRFVARKRANASPRAVARGSRAVSMTRVCVGMRSRIVTARRETREETTRRRIARGVDVARAWTSRADARCAVVWRAFVIRHSSSLDARRRGRASARVEDARDDARESARVRDDDDDACATPARETTVMDSRRRTVSFAREDDLERSVGVADADVDRADVWELPRTCDSCGNYILPGRARWACARCLEEGVEYDACETCLARLAREESARVKRGKGKKGAKKRKVDAHAHGRAAFVLAEAPDEEDEDEKR
jgi:hypothetical protein